MTDPTHDTEPRPPLGDRRTPERLSDYLVAHNAWQRDQAAKERSDAILAELAARRYVTEADLLKAAERLREAS